LTPGSVSAVFHSYTVAFERGVGFGADQEACWDSSVVPLLSSADRKALF